ncbi:MAG: 2-C-methyl-D-erythritol 4-phosphate cytidylyltransferase, partial [candidate division WOR-3 bacterium]|nr:2-C-methyl-D-erythritol 4-phosphate cytidylyltransferase [candidate division WOR-3 bacterium]
MLVSTIIVAAGSGKRMGTSVPKQFLDINGIPILSLSLLYFEKTEIVNEIIIVVLPEWIDYVKKRIVLKGRFKKVSRIVEGGKLRQDSFQNGLAVA